jgi:hypothetical protein
MSARSRCRVVVSQICEQKGRAKVGCAGGDNFTSSSHQKRDDAFTTWRDECELSVWQPHLQLLLQSLQGRCAEVFEKAFQLPIDCLRLDENDTTTDSCPEARKAKSKATAVVDLR